MESVDEAIQWNKEETEAADPDRSDGTGHRGPALIFTRIMRGHHELGHLRASEAVRVLEQICPDVWDRLPQTDVWEEPVDPRDHFIELWARIESPIYRRPGLDEAEALAARWPLESTDWPTPRDETYRQTVGLLYWFARLLDEDGRFFLSCRKLGRALGIDPSQASRYLRRAVKVDEILEVLRVGTRSSRLASEYRFRLEMIEVGA